MGVQVRGGGAGGELPSQIRAKQWGKFGQSMQEECVKFRANQPLYPLNQRVPIRPCVRSYIHDNGKKKNGNKMSKK